MIAAADPTAGLLPAGAMARALTLLARAATRLDQLGGGGSWSVDVELVGFHLLLPLALAATNDLPPPAPPPAPMAAPGGGWVHVDLGPDDADTWDGLLAVLADEVRHGASPADAEELACRAQQWRLAVTPYRMRRPDDAAPIAATTPETPPGAASIRGQGGRGSALEPLRGVRIVDLTAMWAGPLATWLAAQAGAEVIKVEAACRPDGLRRGPRPAGAGPGDGAHFVALDGAKTHRQLDLRDGADLRCFEALVADADVVIDSFSPRVRPNLGIDAARLVTLRPDLIDVSLTAFDQAGPCADWVAYGGGVHAIGGLAWDGRPDTEPTPALFPYPDPLAGIETFVAILDAIVDRRATGGPRRLTRSLARAVAALPGPAAGRPAPIDRPDTEALCRRWTDRAGELTVRRDGCRVPRSPLQQVGAAR